MRDDDKRPPIRGAVHAESERQTHIQERIRQDTRGMRGKARRADKNHESGNCGDEKTSEEGITHRGATTNGHPSKFALQKAKKRLLRCFNFFCVHRQIKHNRKYCTNCT